MTGQFNLHGSAVAIDGTGVLILGASGSGKSGLALRMMAQGARLISDDRVLVKPSAGRLIATAPPGLRGIIEARGIGLLRAEAVNEAPLALAVDLDRPPAARMPHLREFRHSGLAIELILGGGMTNLETTLVHLLRFGRANPA